MKMKARLREATACYVQKVKTKRAVKPDPYILEYSNSTKSRLLEYFLHHIYITSTDTAGSDGISSWSLLMADLRCYQCKSNYAEWELYFYKVDRCSSSVDHNLVIL